MSCATQMFTLTRNTWAYVHKKNGCNNLLPNEPVQMQTSSTRGESVADVMVREPELHEPEPQTGNRGIMEANLDIIKSSSCYI